MIEQDEINYRHVIVVGQTCTQYPEAERDIADTFFEGNIKEAAAFVYHPWLSDFVMLHQIASYLELRYPCKKK